MRTGDCRLLLAKLFKVRLLVSMPGSERRHRARARVHAANCTKLAKTASSPTLQQTFLDLAKQWTRLANELDDAYALLKALNDLDLKTASTSPNESDLSAAMPLDRGQAQVQ